MKSTPVTREVCVDMGPASHAPGPAGASATMSAVDTPPTWLMVLDGISGDFESVASLRERGGTPRHGLTRVAEHEVIDALRSLLDNGFVDAWERVGEPVELVRNESPGDDDASLRSSWFTWTPDGERAWQEGRELLDAYDDGTQRR